MVLMLSPCAVEAKEGVRAGSASAAPDSRSTAPAARETRRTSVGSTGTPTQGTVASPDTGADAYLPSLRGTSFRTFNSYYIWNNYYSYLASNFGISPAYFDRFFRNSEPLITPRMLKLTLREPISLSSEILDSVDQLQEMVEAQSSGTPSGRQALAEKSRHIRELAKQIRRNQTLSYFDLRQNKNLLDRSEHDTLSPEAMQRLRGIAADLDRQLRTMYRQSTTSTVSVDSYKEPSLESLTKGIEKICKAIETQSKKL